MILFGAQAVMAKTTYYSCASTEWNVNTTCSTIDFASTPNEGTFAVAGAIVTIGRGFSDSFRAITVCAALKANVGSTLNLSTFTFAPTTTNVECGSSGSTISGTGLLTIGRNITDALGSGTGVSATICCPVALGANPTFTVADDGTT